MCAWLLTPGRAPRLDFSRSRKTYKLKTSLLLKLTSKAPLLALPGLVPLLSLHGTSNWGAVLRCIIWEVYIGAEENTIGSVVTHRLVPVDVPQAWQTTFREFLKVQLPSVEISVQFRSFSSVNTQHNLPWEMHSVFFHDFFACGFRSVPSSMADYRLSCFCQFSFCRFLCC